MTKGKTIKAIVIDPWKAPEIREIEPTLEGYQAAIGGGDITLVPLCRAPPHLGCDSETGANALAGIMANDGKARGMIPNGIANLVCNVFLTCDNLPPVANVIGPMVVIGLDTNADADDDPERSVPGWLLTWIFKRALYGFDLFSEPLRFDRQGRPPQRTKGDDS